MNWVKNLPLIIKVFIIAFLGILGLAFSMMISANYLQETNVELEKLQNQNFQILKISNQLQVDFIDMYRLYEVVVIEKDEALFADAKEMALNIQNDISKIANIYPDMNYQSNVLMRDFRDYHSEIDGFTNNVLSGALSDDNAFDAFDSIERKRNVYEQELRSFTEEQGNRFSETLKAIQAQGNFAIKGGIGVGVSVIAMLCIVGYILIQSILVAILKAVQSGRFHC